MEEQKPQGQKKGNKEPAIGGNPENLQLESRPRRPPRRHLDHLVDLTNGVHYTPIPEPIRSAWFDKKISDTKMRFIMMMLGNSADFRLKQTYLRKRFHPDMIKRFTKELVEDGVLRLESVRGAPGRPANIHHVNPIARWRLRELSDAKEARGAKSKRSNLNGLEINGSDLNGLNANGLEINRSDFNVHNETKTNQTNLNQFEFTEIKSPPFSAAGTYKASQTNTRVGASVKNDAQRRLAFFATENFDVVFAIEGRTRGESLGFDFVEANNAVASVVEQIGFERAKAFATYALAYKRKNRRIKVKPSELPKILKRFLSEPTPNGVDPYRDQASEGESAYG